MDRDVNMTYLRSNEYGKLIKLVNCSIAAGASCFNQSKGGSDVH